MTRITWTNSAVADLESIYEYISKDSSFYADRQITKLIGRTDILETFPGSGRIVPEFQQENLRELIEGNYRIIYFIAGETDIFILRVHHSAMMLKI